MRWFITLFLGIMMMVAIAATLVSRPGGHREAITEAPPKAPSRLQTQATPDEVGKWRQKNAGPPRMIGTAHAAAANSPRSLTWEEMIPADWYPELDFEEYDLEAMEDDDDMAIELLDKLMAVWAEAPIVEELDGQLVQLPGFAVPLDAEPGEVAEFLLVPYFGACIHVPPPPANQIVYIKAREPGATFKLDLFETVMITGTMRAESFSSELGAAGYTIEADRVEPYEDHPVTILE